MNRENRQTDITRKALVYQIPGTDAVAISRDVEYAKSGSGPLTMDVYYPPGAKAEVGLPAVVFVLGYSDLGFEKMFGCKLKEMASYISWARLVAALGMVGITYTTLEPERDIQALLGYVRENATTLGIDENRIGIWSCSGNVPLALSLLMNQSNRDYIKCAVLCYGLTMDLEGFTMIADAAGQWGFANPGSGKSVDDLPQDLPLFVTRAGQDQFVGLNDAMDRFLGKTLARNLPVTFVNHPSGPHAFDLMDDSDTSRQIIKQILAFLRFYLSAE